MVICWVERWCYRKWKSTQITINNPKNITAVFIDTKSNEIIEFSLLKENNPDLVEDLIFEINNDTIYKYIILLTAEKIIAIFKHV